MARIARVIAEGVPHHVTQRGNARRPVFQSDADRLVYVHLLHQYSLLHSCSLLGYCLMSNHVHLVAVPARADSLPVWLRDTHGRYATYLNARQAASGHVWQGRYFSCLLDGTHLWAALRYVERNPVRAAMVTQAHAYPWSSAAAHCATAADAKALLDLGLWQAEWTPASWRSFLDDAAEPEADQIRQYTHTGRPLGSEDFVKQMERQLCRTLAPQKGGRPRQPPAENAQESFDFSLTE
jgi:putative transposase